MVDSAWGEPPSKDSKNKLSRLTYGPMEIPPFRGNSSQNKPNLDQGWNDSPAHSTRLPEPGWDSTPLNLEQPCSDERHESSSEANISVNFDSIR